MKTIGLFVVALLLSLTVMAQEKKGGISDFMKEELEGFDQFIDDANKDFINFMRDPWKELEAEQPVEKRVKPEPVTPIAYDEKTAPKDEEPVCLDIEAIIDLTTSEGKQKPIVQLSDVDDITFDKPEPVIKKKKDPIVIVVEEKVEDEPEVETPQPVTEPKPKPVTGDPKPVTEAPKSVVKEPVVAPVVKEPDPVVKTPAPVRQPETKPAVTPAPQHPLYTGGTGRSKLVYGNRALYFNNALNRTCKLKSLEENAIADAYEALCRTDYKPLLQDFRQIKQDLQLNDWGIFKLVEAVSGMYCSTANESVVMQQFLLNEMGYKAKMGRKAGENKMVLFAAPGCTIYGHIFTEMNGQKYYDLNSTKPYPFYMCQKDSPKAKNSLNMYLNASPALGGDVATSTHQAKGSGAKVTVGIPKALMDFYKDYPQCDYGVYTKATVNKEVEDRILSSLAPVVQGKSEAEAANILINFVQTAFEYQRDDEQFGYEKPFFVEELFYYPYSDCEDRSVLYGYLVEKLLGLDVVYLDYPDHIATAVRFNENVGGDYLMVGNQKYTVCDPTYINASIGMTMPQYKNVSAKVLKY